ncbi:hypothetical protein [Prosthecobacter sp.]|jgi:hypothetical protein|uniref:hypothetical protein n=1 Tax=Prosthecobacter sp. TaxID=1965333 RepID=UPI003784DB1C
MITRLLLRRLLACYAAAFLAITGWVNAADLGPARTLFVDLSLRPDARSLAAFDLCVLHPHAEVDMEPGHALGSRYLARLDVSQVTTGSREAMLAASRKVASRPAVNDKRARVIETTDPHWIPWAVEALADPAAKKGFDGFVLSLGAETATSSNGSLLTLAATLRQRYPDKAVLLDFHSGLGIEAARVADGFLALGVYTREGRAGGIEWTPVAEVQRINRRMRTVQMQGMRVFAVDFAAEGDQAAAKEAAQRLAAHGALPFITTPALGGVNLGPLQEISRRVLVLHGWDEKHTGQAAPAPETTATARFLAKTLEWLGYELRFHTARGSDFLTPQDDFSAVVLDPGLILSSAQQQELAAWLPSLRTKKIPLLLTSMPFTDEAARQQALQYLGLGGSAKPAPRLVKTNVASMDSRLIGRGSHVQGRALGFLDLTAPADAQIVLSLRGEDALGGEHHFDQTFLASWGAACLDAAFATSGPQADLPAFLSAWLHNDSAPVPDTTTRDGRRVFYAHIDSTGFSTPSTLPGFPLCAEVMRDRILDRYLLPVTVSVCEGEMRGWLPGQQAGDVPRLEHTARSIFEMPQVQAASSSLSRPKVWTAGIDISSKLNERASTTRHDMPREIAGSMSYIHRRLLPVGKEVNLMLWPANAKPSSEALRFCESLGINQLAAAPTSASPTAAHASASVRLEPLAVRCRFDDVRTEQGVSALEKTFDACAGEPLHAMTAAGYAASVEDARHTRILRVSDSHWIILNRGECRTLRLPAATGVPDMSRCLGVAGFKVCDGQLYVHTMGGVRAELVLTKDKPAQHVHLAESSAPVEFMELSSRRATFHVRDLRPVEMVFGGFEPRGQCAYLENGRPYTVTADANGLVHLDIVCRATVTLQSLPSAAQAAMR